jgi:gliding motility-associated-like protein
MKTIQRKLLLLLILMGSLYSGNSFAQASTEDPVIPNVFTPNNDGVNDAFRVSNLEGDWELMIFDRYGSLVFATQQARGASWNGVNLQGLDADSGIYFYTLKETSTARSYKGSLHLFR